MEDHDYCANDSVIVWGPWKKKFAFLPTKIHTRLPGYDKVWWGTYYERKGRSLYMTTRQRGTILDVIKETK